ncbi:DsbA family oxidoreductase [Actinomadura rubrisoli]|uniref:DsbA family oxidoreductase n=1 Tax=Actinomadura rubrisoli TaxID=2530368 RepID=A0A4R4ZU16_9ACTN|nr:DsbA family oxidoreductase [Actinomadura rubrisoli]TDD62621.1 DsbA family oxidoreductase [Actinomadura rubrisoli]
MLTEIWSDMNCPWCFIGKRRFDKALAAFEHAGEIEIRWRCPRVDPTASKDGSETLPQAMMRKHQLPLEKVLQMLEQVTVLAAAEGLEYRLPEARPVDTFDAHRCVRHAGRYGLASEMMDRLSRAYAMEGRSLADHEELARLAADVGLDAGETRRMLAGGGHADDVLGDVERAAVFGIHAAPTYVFNEKYAVMGAEPTEYFLAAIRQVWAEGGSAGGGSARQGEARTR